MAAAQVCCPPSSPTLKSFIVLTPRGILSGRFGGGDILVPSNSTAHTVQRTLAPAAAAAILTCHKSELLSLSSDASRRKKKRHKIILRGFCLHL